MNNGALENQEPSTGSDTDNLPELKAKAAQDHDKVIRIHGIYTREPLKIRFLCSPRTEQHALINTPVRG